MVLRESGIQTRKGSDKPGMQIESTRSFESRYSNEKIK